MKVTSIKLAGTAKDGESLPRAYAELTRGKDIACNGKTCAMVEATVMMPGNEEVIVSCMDEAPGRTLQRARDARREYGKCEGRKPFGTRHGEAKALERIFDLRRKRGGKRLSMAKIADTLNQEETPTRSGGPWKPGSVHAILKRCGKE